MSQVLAIAGTALRRFMRDRSNWFFVFIFPLLLIVLIGLQFSDTAAGGRVVVVGDGVLADDLSNSFTADDLDVTRQDDVDSATTSVARGRADAAVIVDTAAEEAWAAGDTTTVTIVPGPQATGQATTQQLQSLLLARSDERAGEQALVAAGLTDDQAADLLGGVGDVGPSLVVTEVGVDEIAAEFAGLGRFDLGASQQLSLFVFLTSLAGASFLIQSREYGVTNRELAAPLTPNVVIVGEALGRFVIAFVQGLYIVIGTAVLFSVDWGSLVATAVVLAAFCTVAASAAMVLGSLMDNANAAGGLGVGVGLVLAALGGSMLPLELFPDGLLVVSSFTPHHWAYEAYAEIQREGAGVLDVLPQIGVLLLFTAVLLPLGAWLLRRSTERAI